MSILHVYVLLATAMTYDPGLQMPNGPPSRQAQPPHGGGGRGAAAGGEGGAATREQEGGDTINIRLSPSSSQRLRYEVLKVSDERKQDGKGT